MRKATLLSVFSGLVLPALGAVARPIPCTACRVPMPEPNAIPELIICLAGVGFTYWLLSRRWRRE